MQPTSSSDISVFTIDTVNLLNYSFVDISNSPIYFASWKVLWNLNSLLPLQLCLERLQSYDYLRRGGAYFQHWVECENNLGIDKYTELFSATFALLGHHCSVWGSDFLEFVVRLIIKYREQNIFQSVIHCMRTHCGGQSTTTCHTVCSQ